MNRELSLAWGALLTAQGNGEQLQYMTFNKQWIDNILTENFMISSGPYYWRVKPKTRTLITRTYRSTTHRDMLAYHNNLDACADMFYGAANWELIDTHTIEVEL